MSVLDRLNQSQGFKLKSTPPIPLKEYLGNLVQGTHAVMNFQVLESDSLISTMIRLLRDYAAPSMY